MLANISPCLFTCYMTNRARPLLHAENSFDPVWVQRYTNKARCPHMMMCHKCLWDIANSKPNSSINCVTISGVYHTESCSKPSAI